MRFWLCFLLSFGLLACPTRRASQSDDDDASGDDDDVADDDDMGDDDDVADDDDMDDDDMDDDDTPGVAPMQLCSSFAETSTEVPMWRIDGDIMLVETWRSGGCEDWTYDLCWDGLFLESFPVQVGLYLQEFGDPDPCDSEVNEFLEFSLVPLQNAYMEAYGEGSADIYVNFASAQGMYSF